MNRFKPVISCASAALLAFAVTNFSPASARAAETKSEAELDIEANIAVRFYNTYESMLWAAQRVTDKVVGNIGGADAAVKNASADWNGYYRWRDIQDSDVRDFNTPVRVPNFFAAADLKLLRDTSEKLKASVKDLRAANNELTSYFNNREAKSDSAKKYIAARARLIELVKQTRENLYAFNNPALKLAQDGEARMLKKNPLGPIIFHMREVLDVTDQAPPLLTDDALAGSQYGDIAKTPERQKLANETADKLDALSAKVATLIEKYKNDDQSPLDSFKNEDAVKNCHRYFERIYTDLGPDFIREIKSVTTMLRSKAVTDDTRRALSICGALTQQHDELIRMFNEWSPNGEVAITRGENDTGD